MDSSRVPVRASSPVWIRALLLAIFALFATRFAEAQAPPWSFFDGRSNDELRALARDPHNDVLLRRSAATKLVRTLADSGDLDAADAAGREFVKNIDPLAIKHAEAVRRRSHAHVAALIALGVALGIAALSLARARALFASAVQAVRRLAPVFLFFFLYSGIVGGYLASRYENGSPLPFVVFAACMLPVAMLFRAWSAVGSPGLVARVGRASLAVTVTLATGFLVLEQVNPAYLAGVGM
jgi:hypothetical protein